MSSLESNQMPSMLDIFNGVSRSDMPMSIMKAIMDSEVSR